MQLALELEADLLSQVTFCFIDLETTGTSPTENRITEIGATKVRGGEELAHLSTFVHSGHQVPPPITLLTGITSQHLIDAPEERVAYETLWDFAQGTVLVGHNFQFDLGFLSALAQRLDLVPLQKEYFDTLRLSRKLLGGEVPNHKLSTLARYLRISHQPNHRALDDARATSDIFHLLLERAGTIGVTHLEDLKSFPSLNLRAGSQKLKLTTKLPHCPGVYHFLDRRGEMLYVGKSHDIKSRVRSYFYGEQRRKVPRLLSLTDSITHQVLPCDFTAQMREARIISELHPPFNSAISARKPLTYLYLCTDGTWSARGEAAKVASEEIRYLGPFLSRSKARRTAELCRLGLGHLSYDELLCLGEHVDLCIGAIEGVAHHSRGEMFEAAAKGDFELAEEIRTVAIGLLRRVVGRVIIAKLCQDGEPQFVTHTNCEVKSHQLVLGNIAEEESPTSPLLEEERRRGEFVVHRSRVDEFFVLQSHLLSGQVIQTQDRYAPLLQTLAKELEGFTPRSEEHQKISRS